MNTHADHAASFLDGTLDAEFRCHIAGRALCIPYDCASGAVLSLASRPVVGSFYWRPASGQARLRSFIERRARGETITLPPPEEPEATPARQLLAALEASVESARARRREAERHNGSE